MCPAGPGGPFLRSTPGSESKKCQVRQGADGDIGAVATAHPRVHAPTGDGMDMGVTTKLSPTSGSTASPEAWRQAF